MESIKHLVMEVSKFAFYKATDLIKQFVIQHAEPPKWRGFIYFPDSAV